MFLEHILEFSHNQDFEESITKHHFSSLFSYTTLRFLMQKIFKKQTTSDREVWLCETR